MFVSVWVQHKNENCEPHTKRMLSEFIENAWCVMSIAIAMFEANARDMHSYSDHWVNAKGRAVSMMCARNV